MIRGLYTAASGMLTQQQRQSLLTNNLANINTPGYKTDQGMIRAFPEVMIHAFRLENNRSQPIGLLHQGVFVEESIPLFVQGDVMETGVAEHMAIWDQELAPEPGAENKPTLFFTVEDGEGKRFYTRSGLFTVDAAGQLVTPEGYMVLDDWNYPIQVNGRKFTINEKGMITFEAVSYTHLTLPTKRIV